MSTATYARVGELSARPGIKVLKAADYLAHVEAAELVREARAKAERIVADADEARECERRRGFEAGLRSARTGMTAQMLEAAAAAIDHLAEVERTIASAVPELLRKLLGEIDASKLTLAVVREALEVHRIQQHVTLRVAPEMVADVETHMNAASQRAKFIGVVADPDLGPGQCVLESPLGTIEGDIDRQVEAIGQFLLERFGQTVSEG